MALSPSFVVFTHFTIVVKVASLEYKSVISGINQICVFPGVKKASVIMVRLRGVNSSYCFNFLSFVECVFSFPPCKLYYIYFGCFCYFGLLFCYYGILFCYYGLLFLLLWFTALLLWFTVLVLWFTVLLLWFTALLLWFTVLVLWFTVLLLWFTVLFTCI